MPGYYRSRFALGWIANVCLTALFYVAATRGTAAFGAPGALHVELGDAVAFDLPRWAAALLAAAAGMLLVNQLLLHRRQPVEGAIFITGCDSGMGLVSAMHLAKLGFHVFAGCYLPASKKMLKEMAEEAMGTSDRVEFVHIDVTNTSSIAKAVKHVDEAIESKGIKPGLVGLINCAGIAIIGPCEYLPMSMYRQLFDVNYFGYIETAQAFLPLLKRSQEAPGSRRGRVVFVGTGGGVMSPAPALLSAYMGSKWAGEAYIQVLRMEMQLRGLRIDGSMISPGFIKPTNIVAAGRAFVKKLWSSTPPVAREEYEEYVDRFHNYNAAQPGDPPSFIAEAMEEAMLAGRPELGYKVGFDSQAAPYAGSLPTFIREWVVRTAMFNSAWSGKPKEE